MNLAIIAPYSWDEATQMACAIADMCDNWGAPVEYYASPTRSLNVYFRWDHRVRHLSKLKKGFETYLWFQPHPALLSKLLAKEPEARHVLVYLPRVFANGDHTRLAKKYRCVLCPTEFAKKRLGFSCPEAMYVPWFSSSRILRRSRALERSRRWLFTCNGSSIPRVWSAAMSTFMQLLRARQQDHLTIMLPAKREFTASGLTLGGILKDWPTVMRERVTLLVQPTVLDWQNALLEHDWLVDLSVTVNSGATALGGLSLGCPAITFDVPPFDEFVFSPYGLRIPCAVDMTGNGLPSAVPDCGQILQTLKKAAEDHSLLSRTATDPWQALENRAREFQSVVKQLAGVT